MLLIRLFAKPIGGHGDNIIPPSPQGLVSQSSGTCLSVHETPRGFMQHVSMDGSTLAGKAAFRTRQKKRHILCGV